MTEDLMLETRRDEIVPGTVSGGPSTSQTIMVSSLRTLLELTPHDAAEADFKAAVMDDNVLGKDTVSGREWAFRQLRRFYGLDPRLLTFRALRDLWSVDGDAGQPLLAVLCAMARDAVLRASAAVILDAQVGDEVGAPDFDVAIEEAFPGAYSERTRRTTAQKVASSWQQSGHLKLETQTRKVRRRAVCTPNALTYASLLGHIEGFRGQGLFETIWARVLDQPTSMLEDLAFAASQRGLMEYRHSGSVIEVSFHELLRPFDGELL